MARACGAGKEHRMRCVSAKKGRMGQGKGRPKHHVACKFGRSKRSGLCRVKAKKHRHIVAGPRKRSGKRVRLIK